VTERWTDAPPEAGTPPGWSVVFDPLTGPQLQRTHGSLFALSDGATSVVGDLDGTGEQANRFSLVAGAYGAGDDGLVRPLPGPVWTTLRSPTDGDDTAGAHRWVLDLRAGTLRCQASDGGVRALRFLSLARPGIGVLRADGPPGTTWADPLSPPVAPAPLRARFAWSEGRCGDEWWAETTSDRATVSVSAQQRTWEADGRCHLERLVAVAGGAGDRRGPSSALLEARTTGIHDLLAEHRDAWDARWRHADIEIDGDPDIQLAVRFALFHLLSCAPTTGEATVGARGLTGLAYAGHVFWDTDVYVLPALSATLPEAARAVLEYRIHRLPAARRAAAARGLPGVRFPWESAGDGTDVTPTAARDLDGQLVPIRTGEHAEHINADIAWATLHHLDWTGDASFLTGDGRRLVTETARYWAGRARTDHAGRSHLYGVIGPDEYHEIVDDNAYTNVLVRWHLRRAAELLDEEGDGPGAQRLREVADSLVDGFDPVSRRHEQFAGFWDLAPLRIRDVAEPPVAADVLLGRAVVARSQVLKQPDVLLLHHLVPDECPPGSLEADLDFELPRIAHGSSLSPAICAALLARAGRPDDALPLFDLAARLDLDDRTDTTAGGLHLATMGGLWQALVLGFAGIRPMADGLHIDPHLPTRWASLRIRLGFHGTPLTVTIDRGHVTIDATEAAPVVISGHHTTAPTRWPTGLSEGRDPS